MNTELKSYVEREIIPRYDHFDAAHRRDHVETVIIQSLEIADRLATRGISLDRDMVYAIAAYHDTGLCRGRERHHIDSAEIIRSDAMLKRWFTPEQINVMADAAEDHRASASHEPRTTYGRVVAEADRVIDTDTIIRRTLQYGFDHYPTLGRDQQLERAEAHLKEKYGYNGYLRLWFDDSPNAERLERLRQLIDDPDRLRTAVERIWNSLSPEGSEGSE